MEVYIIMNDKLYNWINWVLYDELVDGKINAPRHLLGNHDYGDGQVITCYKPHSESVSIKILWHLLPKEEDQRLCL